MTERAPDVPAPPTGRCGWCALVAQIAYVDVLGIEWCEGCYADTFLENFTPDPALVVPPEGAS